MLYLVCNLYGDTGVAPIPNNLVKIHVLIYTF